MHRNHSEPALGVSMQVLWPLGQAATLVRFTSPNEMIIDTGSVVSNVQSPPAGGCRTSVELKMDGIEDCRDVKGFHQVVVLGNHRHLLEAFCELYGIKHIHSPQLSTFAGPTAREQPECRSCHAKRWEICHETHRDCLHRCDDWPLHRVRPGS